MAEQRISPNALLQTGNEAMLTAVAHNPAAIGYSSLSSASQTPTVKMLAVDGRSATTFTTADQTYPLTTPLYFLAATEAEPTGELRAFLAWLQSDKGQVVVGEIYGRIR
jgi:ABC-type phosphate transport system substrate-binding protein